MISAACCFAPIVRTPKVLLCKLLVLLPLCLHSLQALLTSEPCWDTHCPGLAAQLEDTDVTAKPCRSGTRLRYHVERYDFMPHLILLSMA